MHSNVSWFRDITLSSYDFDSDFSEANFQNRNRDKNDIVLLILENSEWGNFTTYWS